MQGFNAQTRYIEQNEGYETPCRIRQGAVSGHGYGAHKEGWVIPGFVLNHVALSGTLTQDPQTRQAGDGTVTRLRIASPDRIKQDGEWTDRPQYFTITIWRGLGEHVQNTLRKGDQIAITGRLRWREYDKDGQKHEAVEITAEAIMPRARNPNTAPDAPIDTTGLQTQTPKDDDSDLPFWWKRSRSKHSGSKPQTPSTAQTAKPTPSTKTS